MGKITLVCTVHNKRGSCSENELVGILESVDPDVIFEEIRPSDFDSYYACLYTLETQAVTRYVKARATTRQVPVDNFDDIVDPGSLRRDIDILFDYAESNSIEYRALIAERDWKTDQLGFRYLNSPEFEELSKRSRELLENIIARSDSDGLKNILSTWNGQLQRRENSMLENIYAFCRTIPFKKGVFLVGAEHISPLIEGIESRIKREANLVSWNIWSRPRQVQGVQ